MSYNFFDQKTTDPYGVGFGGSVLVSGQINNVNFYAIQPLNEVVFSEVHTLNFKGFEEWATQPSSPIITQTIFANFTGKMNVSSGALIGYNA